MKVVLIAFVLSLLGVAVPMTAHAAENSMTTSVIKKTSCDQRAPRVGISLSAKAQRVGYGYPESDTIYWLDTNGVAAGTHRYTLKSQPFGTTRQWIMVAAFKGDQGLYTSPVLTFRRPAKSACVVTRVHALDTYRAGINTVCPIGSDTMYIVTVAVKRGTPGYFTDAGIAKLVQRNGTILKSGGGYIVPNTDRKAEFYVYAGRRSRLQLDAALNRAVIQTSSDDVETSSSVYRTCQGEIA